MGVHEALVYLGLAEEKETKERFVGAPTREIRLDDAQPSVSRTEERPRADVTPIKRERPQQRVVAEPQPMTDDVSRIAAIHPAAYNDAKKIGEAFRDGVPVIMNLTEMDDADAKRLVDFSAGLVFGMRGSIERVTAKVFLLTPANYEVSNNTAPARQKTAGFYNQS